MVHCWTMKARHEDILFVLHSALGHFSTNSPAYRVVRSAFSKVGQGKMTDLLALEDRVTVTGEWVIVPVI